ncbi:unnamed protein product [Larinioides sclopetarius]|uniref:DDE Tnp4 domain-containing protein n=1 Tax=Larinioides sclopetarius TaxID=280406 RepID=A0AAV2BTG3_9ARAC
MVKTDSNILQQTEFWSLLCSKKLNIPNPTPLPPEGIKVQYVFVADDAFPMQKHMRSYGGHNLSIKQKIFNYRLSKARKYVECAFGILCNKWRIFHTPLNLSKETAIEVVKASVILHNIVREMDGFRSDDLVLYHKYCIIPQKLVNIVDVVLVLVLPIFLQVLKAACHGN